MAQDIRVALTLNNKQFNAGLKQSEKNVKTFASTTSTATKSVGGLVTAFKALIGLEVGRQVVSLADEYTNLNNRLIAVTKSEKELATAQRLVAQVASDTRSDLSSIASLYSDITTASESLGLSQQKVADITKTFSQTLKISGADTAAASGAIRQFGQALASGVLRGDEFNSINEANKVVMGELARELGVSRGELRGLAEDGKLTSDVLITAFEGMRLRVDAAFGETTVTVGAALTNLRNQVLLTVGAMDETTGASGGLVTAINSLADAIRQLAPLIQILGAIAGTITAFVIVAGKIFILSKAFNVLGNIIFGTGKKFTFAGKSISGYARSLANAGKQSGIFNKVLGAIGKSFLTLLRVIQGLSFAKIIKGLGTVGRQFKAIGAASGVLGKSIALLKALGATALFVARKFIGLLAAYEIVKLIAQAITKLVDIVASWFGLEWNTFETITGYFDSFEKAIGKALKTAWDWIAFWKEAEPATEEGSDSIDDATKSLQAFEDELKKVRSELASGYLANEEAGEYATEWEKAQKRVADATRAISVLQQAIGQREAFVGPLTEEQEQDLEKLRNELQATQLEMIAAGQAAQDLQDGWTDSFETIQDALADGLGLQDLTNELADFNLSDLDKAINAELRRLQEVAQEQTKELTDLISDPDIDPSLKGDWQTLLDAIPQQLAEASDEAKRLITELFAAEEAKEAAEETKKRLEDQAKAFKSFTDQLATADTPRELEAITDRLNEMGRVGDLTATQVTEGLRKIDDKAKELTAGAGIGQAIEDIARGFEPFQMAVDATNMAWGHMSTAIDNFVEDGKASFSDLAKSILKDLAKMILKQMIFNALIGALKGGGTALGFDMSFLEPRATGGPVQKNKPYMVGEQGPEMFVPGATGAIVPNNRLGDMSGQISAPVTNNYITNNINALDSRSVAQVFAENRQTLLGTVEYARKETAYGV